MKILKTKLSRNALSAAWAYRRVALNESKQFNHDFSLESLMAMYNYETYGKYKYPEPDKCKNGYAYGKWLMDLTVAMWKEDLMQGNFCKHELLKNCSSHYKPAIRNSTLISFFGYTSR